jgi:hypothetical protein
LLACSVSRWLTKKEIVPLQKLAPAATESDCQTESKWMEYLLKRENNNQTWQAGFLQAGNTATELAGRQPASAMCSKNTVSLTLKYVLDIWYCRNDKEHEKDKNEPLTVKARNLANIDCINTSMTKTEIHPANILI